MKDADKLIRLSDAIASLFQDGIHLTDRIFEYFDAVAAENMAQELKNVLFDDTQCDHETLWELIFFPDITMQEKLEPLIAEEEYKEIKTADIILQLKSKTIETLLFLPNHAGTIRVRPFRNVPETIICKFIKRLRISTPIEPVIADALAVYISNSGDLWKTRVKIRNSRVGFIGAISDFFLKFIAKIYPKHEIFWNSIDIVLDILAQYDGQREIYRHLMDDKKLCLQMIDRSEKTAIELQKSNAETIMMKGASIQMVNVEEIRYRIELLDRICMLIFGRTEIFQSPSTLTLSLDAK